jgi:hypothetical protein
MSETYMEHKSIFLEACCADCEEEKCGRDDGRQWSEDNPGTCDNCEEKGVRFVRADLVAETKRQRDALLAAAKGVFEGDDPDPEELRPAWRALYDAILECEQSDAGQAALAAAPETKRQRDELLGFLKLALSGTDFMPQSECFAAKALIAECEKTDEP